MKKTTTKFLDRWTARKLGLKDETQLTRQHIQQDTIRKLQDTIQMAVNNSPYYRERLSREEEALQQILDYRNHERTPYVQYGKDPQTAAHERPAAADRSLGVEALSGKRNAPDGTAIPASAEIAIPPDAMIRESETSAASDSPGTIPTEQDFWNAFAKLPFSTGEDLRDREEDFLCVRPNIISRIVTLPTGGSMGIPKRIYFTEEDQQLTVDYFENGMQLLTDKNDTVLILMPAEIPGSIGMLLAQGLENFGAKTIRYGLPKTDWTKSLQEAEELLELMRREHVTAVVAVPAHMETLAKLMIRQTASDSPAPAASPKPPAPQTPGGRFSEAAATQPNRRNTPESADPGGSPDSPSTNQTNAPIKLTSVLLSADYVPEDAVAIIRQAFQCHVYEHYGMTEMGLGCAVDCGEGGGYHIRELDLYLEIIDPQTGEVIRDDRPGEIVFTTLTRKGMPFIRYRTGDRSRWILQQCPCGSILKKLGKVESRNVVKGYLRSDSEAEETR